MKKIQFFFIRNSINCKNLDFKYVGFITLGALEASQKRFHQVSSYTKPTVKEKRDLSASVDNCQLMRTLSKPTYLKNKNMNDQLLIDLRAKLPIKNSKFCGLRFNNRQHEIYVKVLIET